MIRVGLGKRSNISLKVEDLRITKLVSELIAPLNTKLYKRFW